MPDCPTYEELRAECLAWHGRAALLERQLLDKDVEIVLLKEQNRMLAIENVRLINNGRSNQLRLYETRNPLWGNESLQNQR